MLKLWYGVTMTNGVTQMITNLEQEIISLRKRKESINEILAALDNKDLAMLQSKLDDRKDGDAIEDTESVLLELALV